MSVVAYGNDTSTLQPLSAQFGGFDAFAISARPGPAEIGTALSVTSADVFEIAATVFVEKHAVVIHQSDTSETAFLFDRRRNRLVAGNDPGVTVHAVGPASARIATTAAEVRSHSVSKFAQWPSVLACARKHVTRVRGDAHFPLGRRRQHKAFNQGWSEQRRGS